VLAGDKIQRRQVKPGIAAAGWVAIAEGLNAGERVVRYNLGPLKDGSPARVKPAAASPAAPPAAPPALSSWIPSPALARGDITSS
jgi:hypothetical protein